MDILSNHILRADNSNRNAKDRLHVSYLAINIMNSCSMAASCRDLEWIGVDIRVFYADSSVLERSEEAFMSFLDLVRDSEVLLVNCHGDPRSMHKFDRLLSVASGNGVRVILIGSSREIESRYSSLSGLSDGMRAEFQRYIRIGGEKNNLSALMWLCRNVKGYIVQVPDLAVSVQQGIYRPGKGMIKDEKGFIASLPHDRPVIAVMFYQRIWLEGNLSPIDALISRIESAGAFAYPIFFISSEDPVSGSIGVDAVIKRYLMSGRKSVANCIVMVGGFAQDSFRSGRDQGSIFSQTDVPVIQANILNMTSEAWQDGTVDLSPSTVSYSISQPEFDGQIISVPLCFSSVDGRGEYRSAFVQDRVDRIASLAAAWARLRRIPRSGLRIAVVLNSDRMSDGRAGSASGLDSFGSVRRFLMRLSKEGADTGKIPAGDEIFRRVMKASDHVSGWSEASKGQPALSSESYRSWFSGLSAAKKREVIARWGEPPESGAIPIPGAMFGNVFVGIEPEKAVDVHGHVAAPSHYFCAFYRWISKSFGADAVVHMGTRGTLEHLPGKSMMLSSSCWPDILMGSMPNLYPFALDDLGDGTVAKRRTASVLIGYLPPPAVRAGAFGIIGELDAAIQKHLISKASMRPEKTEVTGRRVCGIVRESHVLNDICLPPDLDDSAILRHIGEIQDYILELKNARISCGLHVLGVLPKGRALAGLIDAALSDGRGSSNPLMDALSLSSDEEFIVFIEKLAVLKFDEEKCAALCEGHPEAVPIVADICGRIYPALCGVRNEMDMLVHGIAGGFIPPGPAGVLSSGRMHILPTGRNICMSDPLVVPTELSWEMGSEAAEEMVRMFVRNNGRYPDSVAIMLSATDLIGGGGDSLAMALRLMGVTPVRDSEEGLVVSVRPISLEELGRPRIDVEARMSPLVSCPFPNIERLIGMALDAVSELDESDEDNAIKKHLAEDQVTYIRGGMDPRDAESRARTRVFRVSDGFGARAPDVAIIGPSDPFRPGTETLIESGALSGFAGTAMIGGRPASAEIAFAVRTRMLNPSWIEGMSGHGADGAGEISRIVHGLLVWASGSGLTESWMFEESFKALVAEDRIRKWMARCNPYALRSVCEDYLAAAAAGHWDASEEDSVFLRNTFLEAEGLIEDHAAGKFS